MLQKPSKEVNKLIREVMGLAVEVTNSTEHVVFVEYAGHTNQIDIRCYIGGWSKKKDAICIIRYGYLDTKDARMKLLDVKNTLLELLKN